MPGAWAQCRPVEGLAGDSVYAGDCEECMVEVDEWQVEERDAGRVTCIAAWSTVAHCPPPGLVSGVVNTLHYT